MAMYNRTLGKFQLVDLPPAPRGIPQIEVTFDIDANGIVHVSAKDKATSKEQSMTITGQSAHNRDEIDRMVRDAEAHAEEDRRRREEAEIRNNADSLVYQTEKMLKDQAISYVGTEKERVEADLKTLKDALGGTEIEPIRRSTDALASGVQELGKRLYDASTVNGNTNTGSTGSPSGSGSTSDAPNDEEVVDAEIVDEHGA
jgi:molecular chaperone DnaK